MTDNVVGIHGRPVPELGKPNDHLIAEIERLLEMARSGEIQGLLGAYLYRDGCTAKTTAGIHSFSLVGRACCAVSDAAKKMEEEP